LKTARGGEDVAGAFNTRVHLLNWLRQQFQHHEAYAAIARLLAA